LKKNYKIFAFIGFIPYLCPRKLCNCKYTNKSQFQNSADMEKKAFLKGWYKIPQGDVAGARIKMMSLFGVTTRMAFLDRLNGKVNHTQEQIDAVEGIFHSYGITEIWGAV